MKLIVIAALVAVCGAAKLDRSYLPPASANNAGGSPGAIQTPFSSGNQDNQINQGNQGANQLVQGNNQGNLQRNQGNQGNQGLGGIPRGGFNNENEGVVVDAAAPGTRNSGPGDSGLGAPRQNYGSQNSKVGEAAFRDQPSNNQYQNQANEIDSRPHKEKRIQAQPALNQRANAEQDRNANILRQQNEIGTDNYNYNFENSNGIRAEQSGVATNGNEAQGGYQYIGDDGEIYSLTYTAGADGYKPVASYLPTPPPTPDYILKALEQNARDEAAGIRDDGSYDAQQYNAGGDYNGINNNGQYNGGSSNRVVPTSAASASSSFVNQNRAPQQVFNNNNAQNAQTTVNRNNFGQQQLNAYLPPSQQSNQQAQQSIQRQPAQQASVSQNVNSEHHRHINIINKFGEAPVNSQPIAMIIEGGEQLGESNLAVQPAVIQDDSYYYREPVKSFEATNVQQQNNQINRQQPSQVVQNAPVSRPSYQTQQVSAPVQGAQPSNNGVTQATISSFQSAAQNNAQQVQQASRPIQQQPQRLVVQQQSNQQSNQQSQVQERPAQQYNGEIYQYNKPAQTLPPPDATPQSSMVAPTQASNNRQVIVNRFDLPTTQQIQVNRQGIQVNTVDRQPQQSYNVQQQQVKSPQQQKIAQTQQQQIAQPQQQQIAQPQLISQQIIKTQRQQTTQPQQVQYQQQQQMAQPQQLQYKQQQTAQPQQVQYQKQNAQLQQNSQRQENVQPQHSQQYNVQQNAQRQQNIQSQQQLNSQRQQNVQPQQQYNVQQNAQPQQQYNAQQQQNAQLQQNAQQQQNTQRQQNAQQQQIAQLQQNSHQQQNVLQQQNAQLQQNAQQHQNAQRQQYFQLNGQNQQFGDQFQGQQSSGPSQFSSSPVSGQGEQFGGPRQPPSFNEQTGYQY